MRLEGDPLFDDVVVLSKAVVVMGRALRAWAKSAPIVGCYTFERGIIRKSFRLMTLWLLLVTKLFSLTRYGLGGWFLGPRSMCTSLYAGAGS